MVRSSLQELEPVARQLQQHHESLFLLAADTAGYSVASYYTSLGLFVISVPGLWSLIKRSVKSKVPESLSTQGSELFECLHLSVSPEEEGKCQLSGRHIQTTCRLYNL